MYVDGVLLDNQGNGFVFDHYLNSIRDNNQRFDGLAEVYNFLKEHLLHPPETLNNSEKRTMKYRFNLQYTQCTLRYCKSITF